MNRKSANTHVPVWTAPIMLQGKLVKRCADQPTRWDGFSLRASVSETLIPHHRTPKYVEEFINAKRTVDPTYPVRSRPRPTPAYKTISKGGSLNDLVQNSYSKESIGKVSKPVVSNGKIAYSNATSTANALYNGSPQRFRGKEARTGGEEYVRPLSRKQTSNGNLSRQSQIDTIPGPHRSVSATVVKMKVSPQHITTFTKAAEGKIRPSAEEHTRAQRHRYTHTTEEMGCGTPSHKKIAAKPSSGVAELLHFDDFPMPRTEILSAKSNQRVRPRPLVASDIFASTLQI